MMTYKETLFFIGKCLTITHEEHNRSLVEEKLKKNSIDWDSVVKVSTSHYVFPAVYCNLKRNNFLHYLPTDLVAYMKHITDLNRERNQQIINQAKEINELLLLNNITPIFLKGTGNLLEGLYEDIGERMVGDIDLLIKEKEINKTMKILKHNHYKTNSLYKNLPPDHRHLPRLVKNNSIAALEVHQDMITKKESKKFNYTTIKKTLLKIKEFKVLSYKNQFLLTIFSSQINDDNFFLKNISLKTIYDIYLLSKKTQSDKLIIKTEVVFFTIINSYLALSNKILNNVRSIKFEKNKHSDKYVDYAFDLIEKPIKKKILFYLNIINKRIQVLKKIITNKEIRNFYVKKITS